ncbi:MAG: pantoate--beta-alanine ligase [Myxococcota bacterium]
MSTLVHRSALVHCKGPFREACDAARAAGKRVGLVPTMGALHEGHLSLVDEARGRGANFIVVTVFVNPLQFAEGEDLDAYPRTLEADRAACDAHDVDLVFAPSSAEMYGEGFETTVSVGGVTAPFEGIHRPTHLAGVTTVVSKLFNLTGPCTAVFGKKDYQQWRTLERLARDLDMPVEVAGAPIKREDDGLALSSRNIYLSAPERSRALGLRRGLLAAGERWRSGERELGAIVATARAIVDEAFDRVDYVDAADAATLTPLTKHGSLVREAFGPIVLLGAAHLGSTRLIDNLELP